MPGPAKGPTAQRLKGSRAQGLRGSRAQGVKGSRAKGARNEAQRGPRSSPRSTKCRPLEATGAQCRRRGAGGHPQGAHKVIVSIGVAPSSSKRYPNEGSRDAPGAPNRAQEPQSKPKIDHKSPLGATGAQWRRRRAARHPQEAPDRHPVDLCCPHE